MSEPRFYAEKLQHAIHLILFRRGKLPGAKEWELKTKLGRNYRDVIAQLNQLLGELDLEIRRIEEEPSEFDTTSTLDRPDARYVVTLKGSLKPKEARMTGWRIDNLAGLAMALSYVVSKQGKASRQDVEKLLATKFGRWKSLTLMEACIRTGYLREDEPDVLAIGWRTKAEVDLRELMTLLAQARA